MTRNLLIQSADGAHLKYLDAAEPIHRAYAERHGADYLAHRGRIDPTVHPAWNRLPLMLDAFEQGYEKVVWLDTDTLVVQPEHDIFAETRSDIALLMKRAYIPWQDRPDAAWNDGVLVANAAVTAPGSFGQDSTVRAERALRWVWGKRGVPFREHHVPGMWELNWLMDWCSQFPGDVDYLDPAWNWMSLDMTLYGPEGAYILAWHGMPHDQRWAEFTAALPRARTAMEAA